MMTTEKLMRISAGHRPESILQARHSGQTAAVNLSRLGIVVMMLTTLIGTAFAGPEGDVASNAIQNGVKSGLGQIYGIVTAVTVPIAVVCFAICAFQVFTGGERGMEKAKKLAIYTVIGIGIVYLAPAIIQQVQSWFNTEDVGGIRDSIFSTEG